MSTEHHAGFIDWATFQANQERIDSNTHPEPHQGGGAVREGSALLQGLATCGNCGRRLRPHYLGRASSPGYHCAGKHIVEGRGLYCLNGGGGAIDAAVAQDAALSQWRREVERSRYEAQRAERRCRSVDPENRLVARGLEAEWENRLRELSAAEAELHRREQQQPRACTQEQLA